MSSLGASRIITGVAALIVGSLSIWPTYGPSSQVAGNPAAVAEIRRQIDETRSADLPLSVGWATEELVPPSGTPLAGYGDRRGSPSEGIRDRLRIGALAISDGTETAMLFTADLLIVPPNIADAVLQRLADEVGIDSRGVYFTATHTHAGPGATTRGLLARAFGGAYRREVAQVTVDAFVSAARRAVGDLGPGAVASYSFAAPQFIENRSRGLSAIGHLVDDSVDLVAFRRLDEQRQLVLARYSAHATVVSSRTMKFSAGYPGAAVAAAARILHSRAVAKQVCELLPVRETTVLFAAGAVGSMGPQAPEGTTDAERVTAMGEALGAAIADAIPAMDFTGFAGEGDLRYAAVDVRMPPIQLRLAPGIRLSALTARLFGIERRGRVSALQLGSMRFVGLPVDVSGELAAAWREDSRGSLVVTSFSGGYSGYLSPDAYYDELYDGDSLAYETGIMSWTGPRQEKFFEGLVTAAVR